MVNKDTSVGLFLFEIIWFNLSDRTAAAVRINKKGGQMGVVLTFFFIFLFLICHIVLPFPQEVVPPVVALVMFLIANSALTSMSNSK
jgi:hypothetical protein